ncbi:unnamed protein product [Vitrella brassicaformis CCMP3155]|uniref:Autophagy-related protein 9 n=1 Tax=Vitrella brassicaformis (strain CCMP3155) TaxID=1169540 RepID=A0A0G4F5S4_VITBC|nr:unnamed protein product [Vitrella brassicaformis CCMP3155]|eukprot:CEM07555.1 unnamed protein product [Vitrella brassicaformis CCMP3155]
MHSLCGVGNGGGLYEELHEEPPRQSRQWDAVQDLDRFLSTFYKYYEEKGFASIVASHVTHLVALLFTIVFSFFLLVYVNWGAVLKCDSEETCREVSIFIQQPFATMTVLKVLSLCCFGLFMLFWCLNCYWSYHNLKEAHDISIYYRDRLKIPSDEALNALDWPEVLSLLIRQQDISPFCIVKEHLSALEITNIILREDNFLVALTNYHLLTAHLPPFIPARLMYTKSLLWNVRFCLFQWIFDSRSRIRPECINFPDRLSYRFRWMALWNLILLFPVLLFVTIYFFLRHAEDFRSNKSMPFKREFNSYAEWTFRELNELPHQFQRRLQKARKAAEEYVNSGWQSPAQDSVKRCVKYIAGSFLAVLVAIALWDETPLLFVKVFEKNLLWYLAVFGFLVALSHTHQDDSSADSSLLSTYLATMRVVQHTHYLPPSWRPTTDGVGRGGGFNLGLAKLHRSVRDSFCADFYNYRLAYLLEEIMGVILAPVILMIWLPASAPEITNFIKACKYETQALGDWCAFGHFDLRRHGNELYNAPPPYLQPLHASMNRAVGMAVEMEMSQSIGLQAGRERERERGRLSLSRAHERAVASELMSPLRPTEGYHLTSQLGKLEKSLLSFVLYYRLPPPHRTCTSLFPAAAAARHDDDDLMVQSMVASAAAASDTLYSDENEPTLAPTPTPPPQHSQEEQHQDGDHGHPHPPTAPPTAADSLSLSMSGAHQHATASASAREIHPLMMHHHPPPHPPPPTTVSQSGSSVHASNVSGSTTAGVCEGDDGMGIGVHEGAEGPGGPEWRIWGYDHEAISFLHRIEEFQRAEINANPHLLQELPADLLVDLGSTWQGSEAHPLPLREEVQAAYFFWLEKMYEKMTGLQIYPFCAASSVTAGRTLLLQHPHHPQPPHQPSPADAGDSCVPVPMQESLLSHSVPHLMALKRPSFPYSTANPTYLSRATGSPVRHGYGYEHHHPPYRG